MKYVVIRTSASSSMGMGHFMRCLTLAKMLKNTGEVQIGFICNSDFPENLEEQLKLEKFELLKTKEHSLLVFDVNLDAESTIELIKNKKIDWLIVDHYQIDETWETRLRPAVHKILVIDDLANRKHDCDALLDQNMHSNKEKRYVGLVPQHTECFLGPTFFLLHPDYYQHQHKQKEKKSEIEFVINFGGSDPTNEISKILSTIEKHSGQLIGSHFHIVAGPLNPIKEEVHRRCMHLKCVSFYENTHMPTLLANADFAIGAGGTTMIERCFMGVPSGIIIVADNQIEGTLAAGQQELVFKLGKSESVKEFEILSFLKSCLAFSAPIEQIRKKCLEFNKQLQKKGGHPVISMLTRG
ncbi:UDP-2,4-diacetamido-2,4,6-trideoxy-beta-L-altropyranose hydrolase [Paenibacillus illinoisensis]|uniref:UDP-2,4-diacetamido-2,4, 6-trideoxy-beta-L-altropyranose hydrolase n=1 Tax=Paenibacillus illinoisensis TaxID=59845 RepID=UPI001C8E041F|nr:UDP-2,4-diacetamido-2,4,6-trideoxy-beta-L-altropyranose hydrolase [Paenibacillus illinoisensis]MBY0220428.1 UDP-2,4-diacetamido-2,4,6-trideoxy-beta-L-altropyranose hydrolase [Paenibacillus illinoisensis]